jgi:FkbH-like protein
VVAELSRYQKIWKSLQENLSCQIIQNNFELPPVAIFGNMDMVFNGAHSLFLMQLNLAFSREVSKTPGLLLQDIHRLSAQLGLDRWFDRDRWFRYKIVTTAAGSLAVARSLNALVKGVYGKSRKVLVLDLDNTLWGGVIGDDGADNIVIGREMPLAEAYTAFQEYCLSLRNRGILLAVCSKNEDEIAKQGFSHPSSVLKLEHFSCFKANWQPKHENILSIAKELDLSTDSFVFVDDNPAERAIVEGQIAGIAVPDVGNEVSNFAAIIEAGRYFEPGSFSSEDMKRAALYANNSQRIALEAKFADYGEYLDSLEMAAEIEVFRPVYIERIAQLTNKTNQYNLTTRRYTVAEMEAISSDDRYIGLYGKLYDRFGDNGLVSVVLGRREGSALHLDLWLMSCRVLKRDMEIAMLDELVKRALAEGIRTIYGYYLLTPKNRMVEDHYQKLGFTLVSRDTAEATVWSIETGTYITQNKHIRIVELTNGKFA